MGKVIAVANQKGGVGKSTVAVNIGVGLVRKGKKVLLLDCDPQGDTTEFLGFDPEEQEETLTKIMIAEIQETEFPEDYGILHHAEGVDLVPTNLEMAGMELTLVNVVCRELVLKGYVEKIKNKYDYILIDCPPSLGMITINALAAADSVIIPIEAAQPSIKGMQALLRTIGKMRRQINSGLQVEGIVINKVDCRTNYNTQAADIVRESYSSSLKVFKENIPLAIRAAEVASEGVSIFKHDPNGKAASAFVSIVEEVLENGQ